MENVKKLFRCISVLTLILLCSAFSANAENVSGTVVDDTGEPLIGVSVMLKGKNAGVTTDIDGNYTIQAISEDVGYKSSTSFILAFKRIIGMTPSVYQKLAKERLEATETTPAPDSPADAR